MHTPLPHLYHDEHTELTGWLVLPAQAIRAATLLFPTIINRNPAMDRRASMLADAGHLVLIADFYGEEINDFAQAGALAQVLRSDPQIYRKRIRAAYQALEALTSESPSLPKITVGYCMGGQAALELARDSAPIALAASFHGLLTTDLRAEPHSIQAKLAIFHGDADPMVPRTHIFDFWEEMDHAGANWHFHSYSGVKHGFTDPGSDARGLPAIAYNASADLQSWATFTDLCEEVIP